MKSYIAIIASLGLIGPGCAGRQSADSAATGTDSIATPASVLIERLAEVNASGKTLFGHHDDPVYGHTWKWEEGRSDVKETAGAYPALMSWDLGRIELGDSLNLDGVPFDRIRREVAAQNARGGYNTFSWHLYSPDDNRDSWQTGDSTLVHRMVTDSTLNAAYRDQVRSVARFFKSLTDSEGEPIAVIFRPWHEHSGSWFWWGSQWCTPEDYKALWRDMREVMDEEGVDNVVYAYSPDRVNSMEQYMERYPGDEYVDIMGIDVYHFNGQEGRDTYVADASKALEIVNAAAKEHGKIPAFTETGLEGIVIPDWYTTTLLPLLDKYDAAYVVVWRDAHDKPEHYYVPYPGHPAEEDFRAFASDSTVVFIR